MAKLKKTKVRKGKKTEKKVVEDVVLEEPKEIVKEIKELEADAKKVAPQENEKIDSTASKEEKNIEEKRKFTEDANRRRVKNAEMHAQLVRLRRRGRR